MLPSRLKALRLSHQMTQKELSQRLNVTPKVVSFYELGQRRPPQETLVKIASIFNVSVDYLLGVTNHESPSEVKSSDTVSAPTADFINSLFANDPEGLAKINQAVIEINGLDTLDSLSDEAKGLIKNALLLAAQEVDRIKANK